jgi:phospholipase C
MANIAHVFVLMLENHSFDNIFGRSGIPGIDAARATDKNSYNGRNYPVQRGAPTSMPTDPGHEFLDVFEQTAGAGAVFNPSQQYPATLSMSGFVSNYATTSTEGKPPRIADYGKVMACFDTPKQLPVIWQLATEFAVCDHWFSSLPGPTWPNRFFVHGASSAGLDHSPTDTEMAEWDTIDGFEYPNGSIYDALNAAGIKWRLYNDRKGSGTAQSDNLGGSIAQVAALKGIRLDMIQSVATFASDLKKPYPYQYTFIEPNYGNILNNSFAGGSSQHPMDGMYGGEALIKTVYEAIRNSAIWNSSLLVITYDEHGGFYDSCAPDAATPPGDGDPNKYNKYGFGFEQLGVRVPAVVVSPWIPRAIVDHTVFDHASIPATLERLLNLHPLTKRDASAKDVLSMLSLSTPRSDCPAILTTPAPLVAKPAVTLSLSRQVAFNAQPLPTSGNLRGFLAIAAKTDLELSSGTDAEKASVVQNHQKIKTRGQAKDYFQSVMAKVDTARSK